MIEIVQQGAFSGKYHVFVAGQFEAELHLATLRCKGNFHYNGVDYNLLKRQGFYTLEGNGQPIVQAQKSFWTDRFSFELMERHFTLKKKGLIKSTILLIENDVILATLNRSGLRHRKVHVDIQEKWPVPMLAFIYWMSHIIWRNEDAVVMG